MARPHENTRQQQKNNVNIIEKQKSNSVKTKEKRYKNDRNKQKHKTLETTTMETRQKNN